MRWTQRRVVLSISAAVTLLCVGVALALALTSSQPTVKLAAKPKPSPTPSPTPRGPVQLYSPFTGEPVKSLRPVIAMKIDNIVYARPQTGINKADIVYVLPVEGGLTRFLAVFSMHVPPVIGPVRSAREDDLQLLRQFGRPAFGFSGAQPHLLPVVEHAHIVDLYSNRVGGYYRSYNRIAPYNLYASGRVLLREAKGASIARDIGFRFGFGPGGGRDIATQTVTYPAASFRFTWSLKKHRWLVWMDGSPAMTTDSGQMSAATVVIQHTVVRKSRFIEWGALPPYAETVGHGSALVLRNGKEFKALWSRPSLYGGTSFTTSSGQPMKFARGPVWILLVGNPRNEAG